VQEQTLIKNPKLMLVFIFLLASFIAFITGALMGKTKTEQEFWKKLDAQHWIQVKPADIVKVRVSRQVTGFNMEHYGDDPRFAEHVESHAVHEMAKQLIRQELVTKIERETLKGDPGPFSWMDKNDMIFEWTARVIKPSS
jgi:hypothetical protein